MEYWQNLFFAFIYNVLGAPFAAGVCYPFFGLLLSPMIATAAMTFRFVSVIANALRLHGLKLRCTILEPHLGLIRESAITGCSQRVKP